MSYTETMMEYVYEQYCLHDNMKCALDYLEDEIDFSREEIKDMIEYTIDYNQKQFIKDYESLVQEFKSKYKFSEIDCKEEKIKWPKKSGVYVVWRNKINNPKKNLLYVGMTGKFNRNDKKIVFNSGTFDKRHDRYTPYRFCESKKDKSNVYYFRYGPKKDTQKEQGKSKYDPDAYDISIKYSELTIHCFLISEYDDIYTPELLEKIILTKYLKYSGDLPPANNEL